MLYRIVQGFNNKHSKPDLLETYVRYGKDVSKLYFAIFKKRIHYQMPKTSKSFYTS